MSTSTKIVATKQEINNCIKYLMDALSDRLSEKRTKVFKTGETKEDYRFPFELLFDELPYFSLYVNLKKAIYENLLVLCHNEGELSEEDFKDLAKVGIVVQNGELKRKTLKEFATKPIPCMDLDLTALEEYLDMIETSLLYSKKYSKPVVAILHELFDCERVVCNRIKADGELPDYYFDNEGYFDLGCLYGFKKEHEGSWFYSSALDAYDTDIVAKANKEVLFPYGEHIGRAFMVAKETAIYNPTSDYANRNYVLNRIDDNYFGKFTAVLDTVVNVLAIPAYNISPETVLTILKETLAGMKRVVFAKKLKILSDNKELAKGDLKDALGYSNDKFTSCVALYGDKTVPEAEMKIALKKLNKPETLFDI